MHQRPRGSNRGRYESEEPVGDQHQNEDEDAQPYPQSSGWSASNRDYQYPRQTTPTADDTNYEEQRYMATGSGGSGHAKERSETPRFEAEGEEAEGYIDIGSSAQRRKVSKASSRSHTFHCSREDCSRTFTRASERDRHFRTMHANNGERPHKCEVPGCQAGVTTWTRVDKLKQHNRQWHGPYECPETGCSRGLLNGFGTENELDSHMDEAHGGYEQRSAIPGLHEHTSSGYVQSSGDGNAQLSPFGTFASPLGTFASPLGNFVGPLGPYPQAAGPYFLSSAAPGTTTMPMPSNMTSGYTSAAASYTAPIASSASAPAEMNSLVSRMSNTAITERNNLVNSKHLDKLYRVENRPFFKRGRVFKVSWSEPVGNAGTDISDDEVSKKRDSFTKIRRFIVMNQMEGHCICLPIHTYGGRGVLKFGVRSREHAPLYMRGMSPELLKGEKERGLTREAIEIVMDRSTEELHSTSRLNYAKVYTIEYNVKVCSVGRVSTHSLRVLIEAYNEVHPPLEIGEVPPSPPSKPRLASARPRESNSYNTAYYPPLSDPSTSISGTKWYGQSATATHQPLSGSGEAPKVFPSAYDSAYVPLAPYDQDDHHGTINQSGASYTAHSYPSDSYNVGPMSSAYPLPPHTSYPNSQTGYGSLHSTPLASVDQHYHSSPLEDPSSQSSLSTSQYVNSSYTASRRPQARRSDRARRNDYPRDYSSNSFGDDEANDLYEA